MTTLRRVWKSLHGLRPAAAGASGPGRADWMLVALFAAIAAVETIGRRDQLNWPIATLMVTVVAISALAWRRIHPAGAVLVGVVPGVVLAVVAAMAGREQVGLSAAGVGIVLPYALLRWGSGAQIAAGGSLLLGAVAMPIVLDSRRWSDVVGGLVVVVAAAAIGETVRQRVRARERELAHARLSERERIARDLHDIVAHRVSAIAIRAQAGLVRVDSDTEPAVAEALRVVESEARAALSEMRSVMRMWHEGDNGAPGDGLTMLSGLADDGHPAVRVDMAPEVGALDRPTAAAVFGIAREAVTNARRHARSASRIDVSVARDDDTVLVRIHDDGEPQPGPPGTGYGLAGMTARARSLGGHCEAGPDPDGGWTVTATLTEETRP